MRRRSARRPAGWAWTACCGRVPTCCPASSTASTRRCGIRRHDAYLVAQFDVDRIARRAANKAALQERFGLRRDPSKLLFGVITRLSAQKGIDLLLAALPVLLDAGAQLVVLGSGEAPLETRLRAAAGPDVGAQIGYDEGLAHLIQGGCDALLMPSRFEPCGLTQLCALRYGALPVVAHVGGLCDTVIDANEMALAAGLGTGFHFAPVRAEMLCAAILRALSVWRQPDVWRRLQRNAMQTDVSWRRPAARYAALYREHRGMVSLWRTVTGTTRTGDTRCSISCAATAWTSRACRATHTARANSAPTRRSSSGGTSAWSCRSKRDAAANLYMTLPGRDPAAKRVIVGSHLNSVPHGGNFDGAAGVVAGLVAVAALQRAGITLARDLTVMGIRAEESIWFQVSYIGSRGALGTLPDGALDVRRIDTGRTLAEHIAECGGDPDALRAGARYLDPAQPCAPIWNCISSRRRA